MTGKLKLWNGYGKSRKTENPVSNVRIIVVVPANYGWENG
jgi:hypothetical protein